MSHIAIRIKEEAEEVRIGIARGDRAALQASAIVLHQLADETDTIATVWDERKLTDEERHAIHVQASEDHAQVRVGHCSCGRVCKDGSGRHSRDMWKSHRIQAEVDARNALIREVAS